MRYVDDSKKDESGYGNDTRTDSELDDSGSVFGKYKKMFLLLFVMIAVYGGVFALHAAGIISLPVADAILLPVTLIIVGICYSQKKKSR